MNMTREHINGVELLRLKGRLDTKNYEKMEEQIFNEIEQGKLLFVADLGSLDYVSSSGLRVLLKALKAVSAKNGRFALAALNENIMEVFEISGFNKFFEIYPDVDIALKSVENSN